MSTDRDRDPLDDRLLKRALRPAQPVSADACLDAESLAAWSSGTLSADATGDIDRHLATCARCQALLAAFAETEEAVPAEKLDVAPTVVPFRTRSLPRWIPLVVGALAASVLMWMVWPTSPTQDPADRTMASATPPPAVPPDNFGPSPLRQTRPDAPVNAAAAESKSAVADVRSARGMGRGVTAAPSRSANQRATSEPPAPVAPRPAPQAAPAPVTVPTPTAVMAGAGAPTFIPPPSATGASVAGATPTPAKPEVVMLRGSTDEAAKAAAPARVIAEFSSPATGSQTIGQPLVTGAASAGAGAGGRAGGGGGGRGAGGAAAGGGGGGGARGGLMAVNRSVARVNWRVLASGQVERSVTGGDTWAPVTISPPAVVLNGAAPSPSVCWLVGRTGIILLSTDGVTFRRVFFPDVSDLRSVVAIDEREATVTTTDGRVFKTENGGESWDKKDGSSF